MQYDAGAGDAPMTVPQSHRPSVSVIAADLSPVFLRHARGRSIRPWRVLAMCVRVCTLHTNRVGRAAAGGKGGALTLCHRVSAPPGPLPVASAGTLRVSFPPKFLLPVTGGGEASWAERGLGEVCRAHGLLLFVSSILQKSPQPS